MKADEKYYLNIGILTIFTILFAFPTWDMITHAWTLPKVAFFGLLTSLSFISTITYILYSLKKK